MAGKNDDEIIKINLKKLPVHKWAIATYILGILSLILLIIIFSGNMGFAGKIIGEKEMQQKVSDFVNTQLVQGGGVNIESIKQESGIYVATINLDGENAPLYFTKDGKFISPGRELVSITDSTLQNNS